MFGVRTNESDVVFLENFCETSVLGQKTVAWMHRVGAGDFACRDDGGNIEITVARRRRANAYALVRKLDVHRVSVRG